MTYWIAAQQRSKVIKIFGEILFFPQPFSTRNKRYQYKSNRDPRENCLISGEANCEEDKPKDKKNR